MATKLTDSEIFAFNDEQLDKYLEEHGRVVKLDDIDNMPESFLQRLRDRSDPENAKQPSNPVDFDQVAARLEKSLRKDGRRRMPTPDSTMTFDEEDWLEKNIQWEEDAYEELVSDGGRPLYHIDLLRTIAPNPTAHLDILSRGFAFTKESLHDEWWAVFMRQRDRWQTFRGHQRRGRSAFRKTAEQADSAFAKYQEDARKRWNAIGVTESFALDRDASRQDKLTTWMEYVNSECTLYPRRSGRKLSRFLQERHLPEARYLNWVLDQIPLIKEEMAQEKAQPDSTATAQNEAAPISASSSPSTQKRPWDDTKDAQPALPQGRSASPKRARTSPAPEVPPGSPPSPAPVPETASAASEPDPTTTGTAATPMTTTTLATEATAATANTAVTADSAPHKAASEAPTDPPAKPSRRAASSRKAATRTQAVSSVATVATATTAATVAPLRCSGRIAALQAKKAAESVPVPAPARSRRAPTIAKAPTAGKRRTASREEKATTSAPPKASKTTKVSKSSGGKARKRTTAAAKGTEKTRGGSEAKTKQPAESSRRGRARKAQR